MLKKKIQCSKKKKKAIYEVQIDFVDSFTYLGITLDCQLSFVKHYNSVIARFKQKIHMFCKLLSMIDTRTAVILYKSHLLSFLEYGNIFM